MEDDDEMLRIAIQASLEEERSKNPTKVQFKTLFEFGCTSCGNNTFAFDDSETCSQCNAIVHSVQHRCPVSSQSSGKSIVIKPTIGSFATYNERMFLHCGISNTSGIVFNFDEQGAHKELWKDCLCIGLNTSNWTDEQWDKELTKHLISEMERSRKSRYHQLNNNCYDFVLRFLNTIQFGGHASHTKESIVKQYVEKPVQVFESFFEIHKRIQSSPNYSVIITTLVKTPYYCDGCGQTNLTRRFRCQVCTDYDLCPDCYTKGKVTEKHSKAHAVAQLEYSKE